MCEEACAESCRLQLLNAGSAHDLRLVNQVGMRDTVDIQDPALPLYTKLAFPGRRD